MSTQYIVSPRSHYSLSPLIIPVTTTALPLLLLRHLHTQALGLYKKSLEYFMTGLKYEKNANTRSVSV